MASGSVLALDVVSGEHESCEDTVMGRLVSFIIRRAWHLAVIQKRCSNHVEWLLKGTVHCILQSLELLF